METSIQSLTIRGFKSIAALDDFPLGNLTVLIGANGAGKSNFVDFFRLLRALADGSLQSFVNAQGGGDGLLFLGPKQTPQMSGRLTFGPSVYQFVLESTASGALQIKSEQCSHRLLPGDGDGYVSTGIRESNLKNWGSLRPWAGPDFPRCLFEAILSVTVYHFHDTSPWAPMRRDQSVRDWERFRHAASNRAPFLLNLKEAPPESYTLIRHTVRLIAPFFDDFLLRPQARGLMKRCGWNGVKKAPISRFSRTNCLMVRCGSSVWRPHCSNRRRRP